MFEPDNFNNHNEMYTPVNPVKTKKDDCITALLNDLLSSASCLLETITPHFGYLVDIQARPVAITILHNVKDIPNCPAYIAPKYLNAMGVITK